MNSYCNSSNPSRDEIEPHETWFSRIRAMSSATWKPAAIRATLITSPNEERAWNGGRIAVNQGKGGWRALPVIRRAGR